MIDIYVDGSFIPETNQGAYGIVILAENCIRKVNGKIGVIRDNNIAEYFAIFRGLNELKRLNMADREIKLHTDSYVISQQLKKNFSVPRLKEYRYWYWEIIFSINCFSKCVIEFIQSMENLAHPVARELWGPLKIKSKDIKLRNSLIGQN